MYWMYWNVLKDTSRHSWRLRWYRKDNNSRSNFILSWLKNEQESVLWNVKVNKCSFTSNDDSLSFETNDQATVLLAAPEIHLKDFFSSPAHVAGSPAPRWGGSQPHSCPPEQSWFSPKTTEKGLSAWHRLPRQVMKHVFPNCTQLTSKFKETLLYKAIMKHLYYFFSPGPYTAIFLLDFRYKRYAYLHLWAQNQTSF